MAAHVAKLTRFSERGAPGEDLPEMTLLQGLGVEGDFFQGGNRQVSLLSIEARRWMEEQEERGLCFDRFKENILFQGLPMETLEPGDLLDMRSAVLRISPFKKPCFKECPRYSKGLLCRLSQCAKFAIVEQGGTVRAGDLVAVRQGTQD